MNLVAALDSHEHGDFALAVQALNVIGSACQAENVRVPGHLLVCRVDQIQGTVNQVLLGPGYIHPDGEELRSQVPGAHLGNAQHQRAGGVGEVVVGAEKGLWGVRMGINDDGVFQNARGHVGGVSRRSGKGARQGGQPGQH